MILYGLIKEMYKLGRNETTWSYSREQIVTNCLLNT